MRGKVLWKLAGRDGGLQCDLCYGRCVAEIANGWWMLRVETCVVGPDAMLRKLHTFGGWYSRKLESSTRALQAQGFAADHRGDFLTPNEMSPCTTAERNELSPGFDSLENYLLSGRSQTYTASIRVTVRWLNHALNPSRRAHHTC